MLGRYPNELGRFKFEGTLKNGNFFFSFNKKKNGIFLGCLRNHLCRRKWKTFGLDFEQLFSLCHFKNVVGYELSLTQMKISDFEDKYGLLETY